MSLLKTLTKPSFYALALNGFFIFIVLILIFKNLETLKRETVYHLIMIFSFLGVLVGIHGLLHLGFEIAYSYNPLDFVLNMFIPK